LDGKLWSKFQISIGGRKKMEDTFKIEDRSTWAIGGGLLMGLGAGFFFLRESPLAFVGCILLGLGLGLMVTAIISKAKG
jgi:hypothetical protein